MAHTFISTKSNGNEKSKQIFKQLSPLDLSKYKKPFSPQSVPYEFFSFQYWSVDPTSWSSWFTSS